MRVSQGFAVFLVIVVIITIGYKLYERWTYNANTDVNGPNVAASKNKMNKTKVCNSSCINFSFCNYCWCVEDGSEYKCTHYHCDKVIWNSNGTLKTNPSEIVAGIKHYVCVPYSEIYVYCNKCTCSEDGKSYSCTQDTCEEGVWSIDGSKNGGPKPFVRPGKPLTPWEMIVIGVSKLTPFLKTYIIVVISLSTMIGAAYTCRNTEAYAHENREYVLDERLLERQRIADDEARQAYEEEQPERLLGIVPIQPDVQPRRNFRRRVM